MLAIIGICIYLFSLSFIYGIFSIRLMNRLFRLSEDKPLPFIIVVINGLAIISVIASVISIFMKTALFTTLTLLILSLIYLFFDRQFVASEVRKMLDNARMISLPGLIMIIVLIGYFLFVIEIPCTNYDTDLYHSHLIKWHENYAAVPGLGNLHERLATNSSWIVLAAAFSFSFLGIMSFNALSHFLLLLIIFYSVGGVNNLFRKNFNASNWIRTFLIPIFLYSFHYPHLGWITTPSPDVPTVIFTWIFFCFALQIIEEKGSFKTNLWTISLALISLFLMTIKLSGALLVLFAVYLFVNELLAKKYRNAIVLSGLVLVILTPFLIRNVIFSGYLLFPYPAIDIFSFDWKMPIEKVAETKKVIENWAKFPAWFRNVPKGATLDNMSFSQWYDVWLANQTMPMLKELLNTIYYLSAAFLAAIVIYFIALFSRMKQVSNHFNRQKSRIFAYIIIFIIAAISFIFWLKTAPDLRFGWGIMFAYAGMLLFLPLQILINYIFKRIKLQFAPKFQTAVYLLFSAIALYLFIDIYSDMKTMIDQRKQTIGRGVFWNSLYLPPDYNIGSLNVEEVNGFNVYYATTTGYSPIPSNCGITTKNVYKRGESFQQGFRIMKDQSK